MGRGIFVLLVGGIIGFGLPRIEASEVDGDVRTRIQFLVKGIVAHRERLQSGVYRARGQATQTFVQSPDDNISGGIDIMGAFDDEGRLRFDWTEPALLETPEFTDLVPPRDPSSPKVKLYKAALSKKVYRTQEKIGFWVVGSHSIGLYAPEKAPPIGGFIEIFDVRSLGLLDWIGMQHKADLQEIARRILAAWPSASMSVTVDELGKDVWLVAATSESKNGTQSQTRMWVDVSHGFTVSRKELRHRQKEGENEPVWSVTQEYEVEWSQRSEVWVPARCEMKAMPRDGSTVRHLVLDFVWEKVNEPIPSELFTWQDFNAPDSVPVSDLSTGRLVTIRATPPPKSDNGAPRDRAISRFLIIGVNVALAIVLTIVVFLRRRRSSK